MTSPFALRPYLDRPSSIMTTDYTILAEIKHLFQTRRLKSCLAKCEEELATLGAVRSLHDEFALFPLTWPALPWAHAIRPRLLGLDVRLLSAQYAQPLA